MKHGSARRVPRGPRRAGAGGHAQGAGSALYGLRHLGGIFLALIGGVILYQVFGRTLGYGIPGVDDLAALFLVATAFLSLAYTFRAGGHIRVNLLLLHI